MGYLYPAGGQIGTTFEVIVGGQFLAGEAQIRFSTNGVSAKVIKHYRQVRFVSGDQREALIRRMVEVREKRRGELPKGAKIPPYPGERMLPAAKPGGAEKNPEGAKEPPKELPDHPSLRNMDDKNLRELQAIAVELLDWESAQKRQPNAQISEMLLIEVTIAPNAAAGRRELRVLTPLGVSNPITFEVGAWPETQEQEPNEPGACPYLPEPEPLTPPFVLNGQILPGDVDRVRIRARKGQRLVFDAHARRLIPFLADAVPGWFQATLTLYDDQGREVAFADDYRFDPDPVLLYEVPRDGVYEMEVRDAIYRGREDFVYRVAVGEAPFITEAFPLGGRIGVRTVAAIDGWNLPAKTIEFDTTPGMETIRAAALGVEKALTNRVTYAVDTLPEVFEAEPNDDSRKAQAIAPPCVVNGRAGRPGDVDVFTFQGRAGDEVVAEVLARRLHSPLDSLLRLTDAAGRVVAWNDDQMRRDAGFVHPDMGVLTHHADSYLQARLPADGAYYLRVADTQQHGGGAYAYRLRVSAPRPDFELLMTPATLNLPAGSVAPITVYALRKDGFQGEIAVTLANAPEGFALAGKGVPAGRDSVRMTLTAPRKASNEPVVLRLTGAAVIAGQTVIRRAVPAEDAMQAFLYRHLTPAQDFTVVVTRGWGFGAGVSVAEPSPARVPVGGTASVLVLAPRQPAPAKVELELKDAPAGVSAQNARFVAKGLAFELKADAKAVKPGFADNAIIEVFMEETAPPAAKDAKAPPETRRRPLGLLPAVPYVVVAAE